MEAAIEMVARVNNIQSSLEINEHQCKRLAKVYEEIGGHLNGKGNSMNASVNMEPLLKVMEAGELLISQYALLETLLISGTTVPTFDKYITIVYKIPLSADNREAFEEVHGDLHLWFKTLFSTELVTSKVTPITDAVHDIQAMQIKLVNIREKGGKQPIPKSSLTVALFKVSTRAATLFQLQFKNEEDEKAEKKYEKKEEKKEEKREEKKEETREEIKEELPPVFGKKVGKNEEKRVREPDPEFIRAPDRNFGPGDQVGSTSPIIHAGPFFLKPRIQKISPVSMMHSPIYASLSIMSIAPDLAIPMAEITVKETGILGAGSSAEVKEAEWLGIPHAVKIYRGMNEALMRTEVEVHRVLRSEYVVKLVGLAAEGNTCMILMELMHFNLRDLILSKRTRPHGWIFFNMLSKHRPPFRLQDAVGLMLQIAKGMDYLHNLHYLHGDLKTENVLGQHISEGNYRLKISDFGISVKLSGENPTVLGQRGSSVYRAPEVLQGNVAYSLEADVYSFAMVSYEILTGSRSFECERIGGSRLRRAVIHGRRPRLPWNLPGSLRGLVQRCWSPEQRLRPRFSEICQELQRLEMALVCTPRRSTGKRVQWAMLFLLLPVVFAFLWWHH